MSTETKHTAETWEQRCQRAVRGEYPKQVWPSIELMLVDLKDALAALDAARKDAADMRGRVASSLDQILLETSNMTVAVTRKVEHMRDKIHQERRP